MSADFPRLRQDWLAVEPKYRALAEFVEARLMEATRKAGILARVQARAKDVASFLKKTLRKAYDDPIAQMPDKAGARVIVVDLADAAKVESLVQSEFEVLKYENHTVGHRYDELGYLGVHLDVQLKAGDGSSEIKGLRCEIQIHTEAQHLWDDASHRLSYKAPKDVPPAIERRVYRLAALIELFDQEVRSAREAIMAQPGFEEAAMLDDLERSYYRLTGRTFDRELSILLLGKLRGLLSDDEIEGFGTTVSEFVTRHEQKLGQLYESYATDERCSPLLFQPEALFLFQRMEIDAFRLREAWCQSFPLEMLQDLASIWGAHV